MGTYILKESAGSTYMFNLVAGNGEVVLTSERYSTKAAAENGIESVKSNSGDDGNYDRLASTAGQPYFNLKAQNNQVIGTSQMYSSEQARDKGIASVQTNGPAATTDDQTA